MKFLPLAGAAALCATLLLTTACAKKTTDQSTSSTTDTTQSAAATSAADAAATTAPNTDASVAPAANAVATTSSSSVSSSSGSGDGASAGYIDIPVYPGATSSKDEGMAVSGNGTSVAMKVYTSKDDSKRVAEWYKSHLPSSWQNSIITAGGKTIGTFVDEHKNGDGDQSVIVANQDDGTTRIQFTTKHGK